MALVGAPVEEGDDAFIAMLKVDATGVPVAYRKCRLGGVESDRFGCGDGPRVLDLTVHDARRVGGKLPW